jgi:hypothetical protein
MIALFFACAPTDVDADGFAAAEDCDDADPFVYPGAYDAPADGVDADCVDGDPPQPFVDSWTLDDVYASYSGVDLFVEDTASGFLVLRDDTTAELEITATISALVTGSEVAITVVMAGTWSEAPGDGSFVVYAEGLNYEEQMHINWACAVDEDVIDCDGELKALGGSFATDATFTR